MGNASESIGIADEDGRKYVAVIPGVGKPETEIACIPSFASSIVSNEIMKDLKLQTLGRIS